MTVQSGLDALDPVRLALRHSAEADARRIATEASATAAGLLAAAEQEADRIIEEAREQGRARATAAAAVDRTRTRRAARAIGLRASREAYETLRTSAREAVCALADTPEYAGLRAALVDAARRALGPDVVIRDAPGGGIIGSVPGRRIDLTLATFADRAVVDEIATAEPALAEPALAEPALAEPALAEPAETEPAETEPAPTEPAPARSTPGEEKP